MANSLNNNNESFLSVLFFKTKNFRININQYEIIYFIPGVPPSDYLLNSQK